MTRIGRNSTISSAETHAPELRAVVDVDDQRDEREVRPEPEVAEAKKSSRKSRALRSSSYWRRKGMAAKLRHRRERG